MDHRFIFAVVLVSLAGSVHGATVDQVDVFAFTGLVDNTPANTTLTFPQFDESLGSLERLNIRIDGTYQTTGLALFFDFGGFPPAFDLISGNYGLQIETAAPASLTVVSETFSDVAPAFLIGGVAPFTVAGSFVSTDSVTDAAVLAAFKGTGTTTLNLFGLAAALGTSFVVDRSPDALSHILGGTVTLQYEYSTGGPVTDPTPPAVPLPASLPLALIGLGSLGLLRRLKLRAAV